MLLVSQYTLLSPMADVITPGSYVHSARLCVSALGIKQEFINSFIHLVN